MERPVRDFLESGFATYRENAAWLREAFSDGRRSDLRGVATRVAAHRITDKRIVSPKDVSYLVPQTGKKSLILQTCWPPGSTTERLLLFADLVEEFVEST